MPKTVMAIIMPIKVAIFQETLISKNISINISIKGFIEIIVVMK